MPAIAMALQKHIMEHVRISSARKRAAVQFIQSRQRLAGVRAATEEEMLQIEGLTAQFVAEGMQMVSKCLSRYLVKGQILLGTTKSRSFRLRHRLKQNDAQGGSSQA